MGTKTVGLLSREGPTEMTFFGGGGTEKRRLAPKTEGRLEIA